MSRRIKQINRSRRRYRFALALAASLAATQAGAQTCAPHDLVVERLTTAYGETRQSIALGAGGAVVEVYANLATGTWTFVVTPPDGPACMVAVGQAYEAVSQPKLGQEM